MIWRPPTYSNVIRWWLIWGAIGIVLVVGQGIAAALFR